jgi:hypothetical protein
MRCRFEYDAFLSHSAEDALVVDHVAQRLRRDGLRVWFDQWEIRPGDSIPAKIDEGLEASRVLVFFMSVNAFGSEWTQLETRTFQFRDPQNVQRRLIPLRLDQEPIKGSLAQLRYINWGPNDRDREYPSLLEACRNPDFGAAAQQPLAVTKSQALTHSAPIANLTDKTTDLREALDSLRKHDALISHILEITQGDAASLDRAWSHHVRTVPDDALIILAVRVLNFKAFPSVKAQLDQLTRFR